MANAKEYDIAWGFDYKSLAISVNNKLRLNNGWEPVGGIAIIPDEDGKPERFLQGMVRRESV
jgi:hypothetical protein